MATGERDVTSTPAQPDPTPDLHPELGAAPRPTLRRVRTADRHQIDRWLRNPDVQRWWGNAASAEAEIRLALESDTAACRMIEIEGVAVGYAQAVDNGRPNAPRGGPVPAGAWDCNLFIGSAPHRGQGNPGRVDPAWKGLASPTNRRRPETISA